MAAELMGQYPSGSPGPRRPCRWLAAVLAACALVTLAGCASLGLPGGGVATGTSAKAYRAAPGEPAQPWELKADTLGTQRLYRVRYDGPRGELGFKLALYLEHTDHYRMQGSDPMGRRLWTLALDGTGKALWLDHREKLYCRSNADAVLSVVPVAQMPLPALPLLLLGRMPVQPVEDLRQSEDALSFLDQAGQAWSGGLEEGRLVWWSLAVADEPVVWWRQEKRGGIFSDRRGQQQLRWKETAAESLAQPLTPVTIPSGYAERPCAEGSLLQARQSSLSSPTAG